MSRAGVSLGGTAVTSVTAVKSTEHHVKAVPARMVHAKGIKLAGVVTAAALAAAGLSGHKILTRPTRAYVADTGCGSDLLNKSTMSTIQRSMQRDAGDPVCFDTANGTTVVDKVTTQQFKH